MKLLLLFGCLIYCGLYNCHLHALVADGLFSPSGMFYIAPKLSAKPLEQLFRVRVLKMLEEGPLGAEMARKPLKRQRVIRLFAHYANTVALGAPLY